MERISRENLYMEMANLVSLRGSCPRRQVGAVMVKDRRVISMGYNGAPPGLPHCEDVGCSGMVLVKDGRYAWENKETFPNGCLRAIHAEQNAVNFCARHGVSSDDAAMYSTCATCRTCAQSLVAAGVSLFVYREEYRLTDGIDLLREAKVEVRQWSV